MIREGWEDCDMEGSFDTEKDDDNTMMSNSALARQRKRAMQWEMSVDERRSVYLRRVRLRRESGEM